MFEVCIFSSRESLGVLKRTIENAHSCSSSSGEDFVIHVIVNGNRELFESVQGLFNFTNVSFYFLNVSDKGVAWNFHIQNLATGTCHCIYLDGYVLINSHTITTMIKHVNANGFLGTTGVPPSLFKPLFNGRNKSQYWFHGNCCLISKFAILQFKERKITIPKNMYRVDGFVGAVLSFGLNQLENEWRPDKFCPVTFDASWTVQRNFFNPIKELKTRYRRKMNQIKGEFENCSITFSILKLRVSFEDLPNDIYEIIKILEVSDPVMFDSLKKRSIFHRKFADFLSVQSRNKCG